MGTPTEWQIVEYKKCPDCGSPNLNYALDLDPTDHSFLRCEDCGAVLIHKTKVYRLGS